MLLGGVSHAGVVGSFFAVDFPVDNTVIRE